MMHVQERATHMCQIQNTTESAGQSVEIKKEDLLLLQQPVQIRQWVYKNHSYAVSYTRGCKI